MKEKLLNSTKKSHQTPISLNSFIMTLIYATTVSLSIRNNHLFLEELLLCGFIIGVAIWGAQNEHISK